MSKRFSLVMPVLVVLCIVLAIRTSFPSAISSAIVPDSSFSAKRAYVHLLEISRLPHGIGTAENQRVRAYIMATCKQLGLEVQVQHTTSLTSKPGRVTAANVYNIIAQKKGQRNGKALLLMAHYDSQPNTPGAGDNGASVAAMLETARALKKTNSLQNDLILLFTDGEEIGLMGANAFVNESPLLKNVGMVMNFEGRGNSGPSNMFEVSSGNGWAIGEYARSAAHPFANSLGYEIYKKLPNYTDYAPFKNAGITGLNNAYIDGFVNYHSPNDKAQNMDLRSLQQQGENMLSMTKHFGTVDINGTKAADASYFNLFGNLFVHYPASLNLVFVILTNLLFIAFIIVGLKKQTLKPAGLLAGAILFPAVLGIQFLVSKYLLKFILKSYPLYSHFDENNAYNSAWYFLAMSGLAVGIFTFIYQLASRKINANNLLAGILLTAALAMNLMQYMIPSASYFLFIPLLFILVTRLYLVQKKVPQNTQPGWLGLLSALPVILLLAPTVYYTFLAFGLGSNMPFVVIAAGLCAGLLYPVFYEGLASSKLAIPIAAFTCFIVSIGLAHSKGAFSAKQPLQSCLWYSVDADAAKAKWISDFCVMDKWSEGFFKNGGKQVAGGSHKTMLVNEAPLVPLLPPAAFIKGDTTQDNTRKLLVHFAAARESVTALHIAISESSKVRAMLINDKSPGKFNYGSRKFFQSLSFSGIDSSGFDAVFQMEPGSKLDMVVTDHSIGLPTIPGFNTSYPADIIPASGGNSNTTQVSKHFVF